MAMATSEDYSDLIELGIDIMEQDELTLKFNKCAKHVQMISGSLSDDILLQLYSFYKQALEGPCNTLKPSWYDMKGKAKWEAWKSLGGLERNEAKSKYVERVLSLDPNFSLDASDDKKDAWGVHVSSLSNNEVTSLPKALCDFIREGDLSKVRAILTQGCEYKDQLDEAGMGPLHYAADIGNVHMLTLLIHEGCNINLQDSEGQTALHYASSCGHAECIKMLLSKGAQFNLKDQDGNTAANVASDDVIRGLFNQ